MTRTLLLAAAVLALAGCGVPPAEAPPTETPPAVEPRWEDPPEAEPTAIRITALAVTSSLIPLGTDQDGAIIVPEQAGQASWWTDSPRPGDVGPAVILGHINLAGEQGVFARLGELKPGDIVSIGQATGNVVLFAVYKTEQYPKQDFTRWRERALGNRPGPELRLISCGGLLNTTTRHYDDNIIVYAREIP
jgi:sortase (surface protein transpeptidase)